MNIYIVYHEFESDFYGEKGMDKQALCAFNKEEEAQAFCKANEHIVTDEFGLECGKLIYEALPLFNKATEGNAAKLNNEYFPDRTYYGHWPETETIPSSTAGDYSPNNLWDAPGMSVSDFI